MMRAALALVAILPSLAAAQRCPAPAGANPALADLDGAARLAFIRTRLHAHAQHAVVYMSTWSAIHGGIMTFELAQLPSDSRDQRPDHVVGGISAAVGLLSVTIVPPRVLLEDRKLTRKLRSVGNLCDQVALAERALAAGARDDVFARGALMHVGSFLFNVGLGVILGAGYGHIDQGTITAVSGILVGELMFFSRPHTSDRDWNQYRAGDLLTPQRRFARFQWTAVPWVRSDGAGALWGAAF